MNIFKYTLSILFMLCSANALLSNNILIEGNITHSTDQSPIANARIYIEGSSQYIESDEFGYFNVEYSFLSDRNLLPDIPIIEIDGEQLQISYNTSCNISIFGIDGRMVYSTKGESMLFSFNNCNSGIYILKIDHPSKPGIIKIHYGSGKILINKRAFLDNNKYNLRIEKEGYETSYLTVKLYSYSGIQLTPIEIDLNKDYLFELPNTEQYNVFAGIPLKSSYSDVTSLKVIYEMSSNTLYYINTKKHTAHYYFCKLFLGYNKGLVNFNAEQYINNVNREFFLGTIDYYGSSEKYILQFFASDDITCDQIKTVFDEIKKTSYIDTNLYLLPNTLSREHCNEIPVISFDVLMKGQNYQCLNAEESYGYLNKVPFEALDDEYIGKHDILLTNGIPIDLPVVSGIITTEFQPVLSHINVLSYNRGTPNMALRNGWNNEALNGYINELVYLKVESKSFTISKANIDDAQEFWNAKEARPAIILNPDYTFDSILNIENVDHDMVDIFGGKASNFGELTKVSSDIGKLNLPRGGFAIPVFYYDQHIKSNNLDTFINEMLHDEDFQNNSTYRKERLKILRNKITDAPLDPDFYNQVVSIMQKYDFNNFRFRSSTNAEDIISFNGAGLYDSKTGILNDPEKPIDEAIKKVWASLWNFSAFEERDYFKINQKSVAMGILVHESFPDEVANGVAITKNLYNPYISAISINSQFNEISVVNPEEGYLPEQVLYYNNYNTIDYISSSTAPMAATSKVLTEEEITNLAIYCQAIQNHYYNLGYFLPLDIEFKVILNSENKREVVIKQCRFYTN